MVPHDECQRRTDVSKKLPQGGQCELTRRELIGGYRVVPRRASVRQVHAHPELLETKRSWTKLLAHFGRRARDEQKTTRHHEDVPR